jgi:hypothetical protein
MGLFRRIDRILYAIERVMFIISLIGMGLCIVFGIVVWGILRTNLTGGLSSMYIFYYFFIFLVLGGVSWFSSHEIAKRLDINSRDM